MSSINDKAKKLKYVRGVIKKSSTHSCGAKLPIQCPGCGQEICFANRIKHDKKDALRRLVAECDEVLEDKKKKELANGDWWRDDEN